MSLTRAPNQSLPGVLALPAHRRPAAAALSHAFGVVAMSLALCFSAGGAGAQSVEQGGIGGKALVGAQAAAREYWTPERMRNAKPLPLPRASAAPMPLLPDETARAAAAPSRSAAGKPPSVQVTPDLQPLFEPLPDDQSGGVEAQDVGSRGAQFSSSRVFPDGATTTYPYRAIGKLFFTKPGGGDFICSAAVQRRRVVTTAGHCVHAGNGNANAYYTNFQFVPAYRSGIAPYGRWTPVFVATTQAWINGGATFPNAADFAMFDMADRNGSKIGDVTGYLGYLTNKLRPNHAHLVGYPANLDSGERMHQVAAQSFAADGPNAVVYGSDMTGGSSGGPWIQNLGVPAVGQTGGTNALGNVLIGVTSYGPVASGVLYQGSSIPAAAFTALLTQVCGRRAGNC